MQNARGFTMPELVAVMIIAGILAVFATSVFDRNAFDTASFADEVRAQLTYARKAAVAARRPVQVTVMSNTVSLTICSQFDPCGAQIALASPQGEASFVRTAPDNVTISPDASFSFNAEGGASAQVALQISGDGIRNVVVHAETGYVDVE